MQTITPARVVNHLRQYFYRYIFLGILAFFILLLARDPFSQRTLIPNFEPFPDSFHYLVPADNFAHGRGLVFWREEGGTAFAPSVPPLYSVFLSPIFLFQSDPRFMYFFNVAAAIGSLFVLGKILNHILTKNPWLQLLGVALFSLQFHVIWLPSLVMAENLLLLLFLLGTWLFLLPTTRTRAFLAAALALSFYFTKYAAAPLTAVYAGLYFAKLVLAAWNDRKHLRDHLALIATYVASGLALVACMTLYQNMAGQASVFTSLWRLITQHRGEVSRGPGGESSTYFSLAFMSKNFVPYVRGLLGEPTTFLWETTPFWPRWIALTGALGLLVGLVKAKTRFISGYLLSLIAAQTLFMSTFYVVDMRYLIVGIPITILGLVILLDAFITKVAKNKKQVLQLGFMCFVVIGAVFFLQNVMRLKKQVTLNLKYAEQPWWYISILESNKYFAGISPEKKPVLINLSIPYHIDFFSNHKYTLLPLSHHQDFRDSMKEVWGDQDYSDLHALYQKYLSEGYELYATNWGQGNEAPRQKDFQALQSNFKLELVHEGCLQACNIYRVTEQGL